MSGKWFLALWVALSVQPLPGAQVEGPTRHQNSLTLTASALGCGVQTAKDIKALNLDPTVSWILMRLCATSGATPSALMAERATRSWGEVCSLHGRAWGDLVKEVLARQQQYGLLPEGATREQRRRTSSNRPDGLGETGGTR